MLTLAFCMLFFSGVVSALHALTSKPGGLAIAHAVFAVAYALAAKAVYGCL